MCWCCLQDYVSEILKEKEEARRMRDKIWESKAMAIKIRYLK